ncbi:MAG: hypothetical protein ACHQAX_08680 [Gammaproteobacteria bacterium]
MNLLRKSDKVDLPLFNIPGIGPSIPFQDSMRSGRHGSVSKHLAASGKVFALKTVLIKEGRDLERFNREHHALKALGLLEGVVWPKKVGDEGLLAFPFYEGLTANEFITSKRPGIVKWIKIMLLILAEVEKLHAVGYSHESLHEDNILIDVTGNKLQVHLVDFGRAIPLDEKDKKGADRDLASLKGLKRLIFGGYFEGLGAITHEKAHLDYYKCSERLIMASHYTLDDMKYSLRLAELARTAINSLDHLHFTQQELTDYLFVSMQYQSRNTLLTKDLAQRLVKDFGSDALSKKHTNGITLLQHADNLSRWDEERTLERILQEAAPPLSYTSASPSVVSFSAKSDDADLTPDEKKKFHFFP